jgi:hypothetical protein
MKIVTCAPDAHRRESWGLRLHLPGLIGCLPDGFQEEQAGGICPEPD